MSLIDLGVDGCGIASLPYFVVVDRLRDGSLRDVLAEIEKKIRAFRLLRQHSKHPLPRVSTFVKFITTAFGKRRLLAEWQKLVGSGRADCQDCAEFRLSP